MSGKTFTVMLQFDHERTYSAGRSDFMKHFTDVIRVINANPNMGKLRYAAVMQADTMASLSRMDASAYGPPQAQNPTKFSFCAPCKNSMWCAEQGRCTIAHQALADAEAKIKARRPGAVLITGQSGVHIIEEDFITPAPALLDAIKSTTNERKRSVKAKAVPGKPAAAAHRHTKQPPRNKTPARKGAHIGNRKPAARRK